MRPFLLLYFLLILCPVTHAQEGDRKIKSDKIPASVRLYIDQKYPDHSKIHFYTEKAADTLYYEAVFEQLEVEYNLLFDTTGSIYETEKTLPLKKLNGSIKASIDKYLKGTFDKYKILEVQEVELKNELLFELNVKGKKNGKKEFYEFYFNREGNFVRRDDIILKPIPSMF